MIMNQSQPKLLPCPFCGAAPTGQDNRFSILHATYCIFSFYKGLSSQDMFGEVVIEKWNTRHTPQPQPFPNSNLLDIHAICEQRDKAVAERDEARAACVKLRNYLQICWADSCAIKPEVLSEAGFEQTASAIRNIRKWGAKWESTTCGQGLLEELKELRERMLRFVSSPAGDLFATRQKLETANRCIDELEQELSQAKADKERLQGVLSKYARWNYQTGQLIHAVSCDRAEIERRVNEWNATAAIQNIAIASVVPANEAAMVLDSTNKSQPKQEGGEWAHYI